MARKQLHSVRSATFSLNSFAFALFLLLVLLGCNSGAHTSDPRLKQIDEMLGSHLPQGTSKMRVVFFLNTQGFPVENSNDPKVVIAIVHQVDTATLQPATARVTFQFDANGMLKTYSLAPAAEPLP